MKEFHGQMEWNANVHPTNGADHLNTPPQQPQPTGLPLMIGKSHTTPEIHHFSLGCPLTPRHRRSLPLCQPEDSRAVATSSASENLFSLNQANAFCLCSAISTPLPVWRIDYSDPVANGFWSPAHHANHPSIFHSPSSPKTVPPSIIGSSERISPHCTAPFRYSGRCRKTSAAVSIWFILRFETLHDFVVCTSLIPLRSYWALK